MIKEAKIMIGLVFVLLVLIVFSVYSLRSNKDYFDPKLISASEEYSLVQVGKETYIVEVGVSELSDDEIRARVQYDQGADVQVIISRNDISQRPPVTDMSPTLTQQQIDEYNYLFTEEYEKEVMESHVN